MKIGTQVERFQLLNKLIKQQRTGSPEELAKRLKISRRQLYAYLDFIRDLGLEVKYSRKVNSFVYCCGKELLVDFKMEVLEEPELRLANGGIIFGFLAPCCFNARSDISLVP